MDSSSTSVHLSGEIDYLKIICESLIRYSTFSWIKIYQNLSRTHWNKLLPTKWNFCQILKYFYWRKTRSLLYYLRDLCSSAANFPVFFNCCWLCKGFGFKIFPQYFQDFCPISLSSMTIVVKSTECNLGWNVRLEYKCEAEPV